ncbi:hypothetical protein D3C81_858380 [compost metagenome]
MDINHAADAVGGDDDKAIVLGHSPLANAGAERRQAIAAMNIVGLFFCLAFIDPFEPAINRYDQPLPPDRPEER